MVEPLEMNERYVLIVGDDPKGRDVLRGLFETAGYRCLLANDGREGVEAFKLSRPPLVVTDLTKPGVTGVELLREVRAVDGDVAVIVLTEAADLTTMISCLKLGGHYLPTFLAVPQLLTTVERALEDRRFLIERRERQQPRGQLQDRPRDVLIVDNRGTHFLPREILVRAGYDCLVATDAREGLETLRRSRSALVVANLSGWETHGWSARMGTEFVEKVLEEDPDAAIIVLDVLDLSDAKTYLKLGAHVCLNWADLERGELLSTAEQALELRQLLIERRRRREGA